MQQISKQNNFVYLFFSLIMFLFSAAVVVELPDSLGEDVFSAITILMLAVSLRSLKTEKTWTWTVYALIAVFCPVNRIRKIFWTSALCLFYPRYSTRIFHRFFFISIQTSTSCRRYRWK